MREILTEILNCCHAICVCEMIDSFYFFFQESQEYTQNVQTQGFLFVIVKKVGE